MASLVDPKPETLDGQLVWTDSLYVQLVDSVPGSKRERSGAARSQPPAWIDAFDTLQTIDRKTAEWEPAWPTIPGDLSDDPPSPTVLRLRALVARKWRPQDVEAITKITAEIEKWLDSIKALFNQEPVRALWAAKGGGFAHCPACDATITKKQDRAGEWVQYPALQVGTDGTTRCGACKTSWGPENALFVCRMLGYPLPEGLLE
ncbi:hypothetical protein C3472_19820 [Mycobacterium kansasii]|nr:hypothetical protein C3472_19820 [Mycobacterium kansasii]